MPNNIKVFLIALLIFAFTDYANAQPEDGVRIGAIDLQKSGANYYNYSDPDKVNIEVIVMGGVKNPGKYLIPEGTTLITLLALSGTATEKEIYENIRIIRPDNTSGQLTATNVMVLNYENLFDDKTTGRYNNANPVLNPGDIVVMKLRPDKSWWDYLKDIMFVITPLLAIANLIVSIQRLNN